MNYKTLRYSGKERDATGLYYCGYRYYQPWAGRWLSADPAGTVDGLNLFRMVRNNPVTMLDDNGLVGRRNNINGVMQNRRLNSPVSGERSQPAVGSNTERDLFTSGTASGKITPTPKILYRGEFPSPTLIRKNLVNSLTQ